MTEEPDDATVVRPRPAEEESAAFAAAVDDATVVRSRFEETEPIDDATVVRPRSAMAEAEAEADEATVVRPRSRTATASEAEDATEASDGTIVRPRRAAEASSPSGTIAPPVEEPGAAERGFDTHSGPGLDPERRIAGVPGRAPWETGPAAERGVRPGAPIVYGARSESFGASAAGVDEVHRRLGDPPPASFVPVREGREALPSMARRAARARVGTLIGYGVAVVVAVLGLWGVAVLALA